MRSKRVTATPDALGARGYSRECSAQSTREYSHGARCTRRLGYVLASAYVSTAARPRLSGWQVQLGSKTSDPSVLWDPAGTEHAGTGRRPSPTASAEARPADRRLATTTTASMQHTKPARATLPNEPPGFRRPAVSQEAGLGAQVVAVAAAVLSRRIPAAPQRPARLQEWAAFNHRELLEHQGIVLGASDPPAHADRPAGARPSRLQLQQRCACV